MAEAALLDPPGTHTRLREHAPLTPPGSVTLCNVRLEDDLDDAEWAIIAALLPRNWRGLPRVDDRPVIDGILWRFRTASPWIAIPHCYGPPTTCYSRFIRWRRLGVWAELRIALGAGRRELTAMTRAPAPRCGRSR